MCIYVHIYRSQYAPYCGLWWVLLLVRVSDSWVTGCSSNWVHNVYTDVVYTHLCQGIAYLNHFILVLCNWLCIHMCATISNFIQYVVVCTSCRKHYCLAGNKHIPLSMVFRRAYICTCTWLTWLHIHRTFAHTISGIHALCTVGGDHSGHHSLNWWYALDPKCHFPFVNDLIIMLKHSLFFILTCSFEYACKVLLLTHAHTCRHWAVVLLLVWITFSLNTLAVQH